MNENRTYQNNLPSFVKSYLHKYGIPGWKAETDKDDKYNNIVVIPAIKEYKNILRLLNSLSQIDKNYLSGTLFLFVINNSAEVREEIIIDNKQSLELLNSIICKDLSKENIPKEIINDGFNIGFVDASSHGKELPAKNAGVGLARKIGMDIALTLFNYQDNSKKIIICLDADCTVEKNYLTAIVDECNNRKISAGHVLYEHVFPENETERRAIICYELFLRYYTLGLKYAQSHFAFTFIGSTMICDAEYYCMIGGMNKRKAAEDFYFLEKLAKVTTVHKIDSTKVFPASRSSWRVPFGTGQRINRFVSNIQDEYLLYNPQSFMILKKWLEVFNADIKYDEKELMARAGEIDRKLFDYLKEKSFENDWRRIIINSKTNEQLNKQKNMWFDGFTTMKLIHYLRDNGYPPMQMFDALDALLNLMNIKIANPRVQAIPDINTQIEYLKLLRSIS
jgi:hypothetical protein